MVDINIYSRYFFIFRYLPVGGGLRIVEGHEAGGRGELDAAEVVKCGGIILGVLGELVIIHVVHNLTHSSAQIFST